MDGGSNNAWPVVIAVIFVTGGAGSKPVTNRHPARRLTGVTAIALDALRKAVADSGTAPPASEHIPPGVVAVSPDLWRRYFYQLRSTESPDANRVAFKRAVTELQNRQIVGCWGDFAWPA